MTRFLPELSQLSVLSISILVLIIAKYASGLQPPRRPPREGTIENRYSGSVIKISKNSITIQSIAKPEDPARVFIASETLEAGKAPIERRLPPGQICPPMMPEYMYRMTDVRIGDWIAIYYARIGGLDVCDHICIKRRPGGMVPPLPKEAEFLRDWRKVWKEKNPGRRLPDWMEKNRRVPYHESQNAYWAKIAPMPHEVKQPGPAFDP